MKAKALQKIFLVFLLLLGSTSLSLTMFKSGLIYSFGMGFWGPNGHDGIWHIALINQLSKFSFAHPLFYGRNLQNYHLGFDILAAALHLLTRIPAITLYFQILPPIMAVSLGILTYVFVKKLTSSNVSAWWATFFVYFGGSWGWLVSLIRTGKLGGESMFWANQAISTMINPPYALSLIVMLLGLIWAMKFFERKKLKDLIIASFLLGILIEIKVYAGVIVLFSLFGLMLFSFFRKRDRFLDLAKLFLGALAVSLAVFLPLNSRSASLLVFSPFWFPRTMLAFPDRLGWFKLENARLAYFQSKNFFKWFLAEYLALSIFIFGNLGVRAIGFFQTFFLIKKLGKLKEIEILLLEMTAVSLIMPLLFIQKGNPWNTIQFFYYFQVFVGIFAGLSISWFLKIIEKKNKLGRLKFIILIILPLLTLPTTISTLINDYLPARPPAMISKEELKALDFLRGQPEGLVITCPFDPNRRKEWKEPKPLYVYETTGYVSALSAKQTFLEDEMNLEISGYSWKERAKKVQDYFSGKSVLEISSSDKPVYLYLPKKLLGNSNFFGKEETSIFENEEIVIYKIEKENYF